jgi:hypothetical protein
MKRFFVLSVTAALLLSAAGCASGPPASGSSGSLSKGLSGVPGFVNDAYLNASEDVLVGVGTYKIGNDMSKMGTGKTFAVAFDALDRMDTAFAKEAGGGPVPVEE